MQKNGYDQNCLRNSPANIQDDIYDWIISICAKSYAKLGKEIDNLPDIALADKKFILTYLEEFDELDRFGIEEDNGQVNLSDCKKIVDFIEKIQKETEGKITPEDIENASKNIRIGKLNNPEEVIGNKQNSNKNR